MGARTAMIDFKVDSQILEPCNKEYLRSLLLKLRDFLECHNFQQAGGEMAMGKGLILVFTHKLSETSCIVRIYPTGLVSLAFEEYNIIDITNSKLEDIRKSLVKIFQTSVEKTPAFKHATDIPIYFNNSEERIMEYDFNQMIFEAESAYQNIKILSSPTLGKCLLLDDLQNLGECDLSYTRGLMKHGQINYKDKEILILGGGDGALLYELLKEDPKFVTLVDIDLMVIEACRKHMRSVCGSALDAFSSCKHQIIVDDCIKRMDTFVKEGRKFDHIFNDLTDIPIHKKDKKDKETEDSWALIKGIISISLSLLKPGGSYLNHAIGITCKDSLAKYEELLINLPTRVKFTQHAAYVPSFMETWTFYEVRKVDGPFVPPPPAAPCPTQSPPPTCPPPASRSTSFATPLVNKFQ